MVYAFFSLPGVVGALLLWRYLHLIQQPDLASHLLFLPVHSDEELLSEREAKALRDVALHSIKTFGMRDKVTPPPTFEDIGEAIPIGADGSCRHAPHPLFVPSHNGSHCRLRSNVDIVQKWLLTGGMQALKETPDWLLRRASSFASHGFDAARVPAVHDFFSSERFRAHARKACPRDRQLLDSWSVQFVVHVPGQSQPVAIIAPYFFGATPERFPYWVLSAMSHSGVFRDKYIAQVQVISFIHEWDATVERGGAFVFWRDDARSPLHVLPKPRLSIAADGARMVHTVPVYNGPNATFAPPPPVTPDGDCALTHVGNDQWQLTCEGAVVATYVTDDLRLSTVYRAKCFKDEASVAKFHSFPESSMFLLDEIAGIFRRDLEMRWRILVGENVAPNDFALRMIKEYVRLPHSPTSKQPFNICSWSLYWPILEAPLRQFCNFL